MSKIIIHEPLQKIRERRNHIFHTLTSEQKAKIVNDVCDRIARGEHLTAIGEEQEMPHSNTIRNWIEKRCGSEVPRLALGMTGRRESVQFRRSAHLIRTR